MPSDLKKAIYDSLTAGKQGVQAAFNPMRLGGPDAGGGLRAALFGGLGAATVPMMAMDEAALGVGNVISEDTGRAAAAVERAGYPGMAKGLAGGGVALGMAPFIGGMALDPEMGAAKAAGAGVLERLAASNLPETVLRKAESIQALHGEKALADLVQEYADRGVPLFSHDLPMDEAARMGRAQEMGFRGIEDNLKWPLQHGTENDIEKLAHSAFIPAQGPDENSAKVFLTSDTFTAEDYAPSGDLIETAYGRKSPTQNGGVIDVFTSAKPDVILDAQGVKWPKGWDAAMKSGENVLVKNANDAKFYDSFISDVWALGDPSNIRAKNAAFDPRMKDSKFLLALKAGAIPLAGISAFSQGEQ